MKRFSKWQVSLLFGLIFTVLMSFFSFYSSVAQIRQKVLRLHVLANSDSEEDQALKLKVRDRILVCGEGLFEQAVNVAAAEETARKNLPLFQAAAEDEIARNGYAYSVRIEVAPVWFETRSYDDFTLPAGEYEAIRVLIGEANGKNWWCVMFPAVCVPAASEKGSLSQTLSGDELEVVENQPKYRFRFKAVEVIEDIKKKLGKR
ncbi:MAG: stage II sporulation protein R [Oscillospiraceae bacterium]|jgi:stage II sporulation protein R|nr:stage II sporulation protein R [Oscillospiraceae bacterium]